MLQGIYTLVIKLPTSQPITIGKLGSISFAAGYYVYVGSAINGLEARIARHLRQEKKLHWHIDYLLKKARVGEIIYSLTIKNKECAIALQLAHILTPIPKFGSSDCHCISHLFFCRDKTKIKGIVMDSFEKSGLSLCQMTVAESEAFSILSKVS